MNRFVTNFPFPAFVAGCCSIFLFTFLLAEKSFSEELFIKKSGTKLQAEASPKSKVISVLEKGASVKVLEKKGKFFHVATAEGEKGWIFKFKLSNKNPVQKKEKSFLDLLGTDQKVAAKESVSGSSIRGLSPIAENHAKKKGISEEDIKAVKKMEQTRVTPEEVERFLQKRKLGEFGE